MPDAIDQVLANLEHNARRFRDEAARLEQANLNGAATVSNDVVTVTVDGSGALLSAVFTGATTDPDRWRLGFGDAYVAALANRRPAASPDQVAGLVVASPPEGPVAPEQDLARARIDRMLQRAATRTTDLSTLTRSASVGGVSLTLNGMRLIVDASATRDLLAGGVPADDAVMAAYRQALAEIEAATATLLEGTP